MWRSININQNLNYNLWCDVGLERLIRGSLDKKTRLLDEIKKEIEKKGTEQWILQL